MKNGLKDYWRERAGEYDRDYSYYKERGWLASDYFYSARLGLAKRLVGNFFDRLQARNTKKRKAGL